MMSCRSTVPYSLFPASRQLPFPPNPPTMEEKHCRKGLSSEMPKEKIHPNYAAVQVKCACGNHFETRSTHRSEEHTSELQSLRQLVCRLLLERIDRQGRLRTRSLSCARDWRCRSEEHTS